MKARGVAASGVLCEGAFQPLSEPRGPYHTLRGLHLEATRVGQLGCAGIGQLGT